MFNDEQNNAQSLNLKWNFKVTIFFKKKLVKHRYALLMGKSCFGYETYHSVPNMPHYF